MIFLFVIFFFPLHHIKQESEVYDIKNIPILTITGSDSTSGSGVQADIKIFSSLGSYALSAITSITVQNTLGIQDFFDLPADIVAGQIEAIINDVQPKIVKIGMVRRADVMERVACVLERYSPLTIIYDPVVVSSSGDVLMPRDVLKVMKSRLLPLCTLITLKRSDAEYIIGERVSSAVDTVESVGKLQALGCKNVLLHCGMLMTNAYTDILQAGDGAPHYLSNVCGGSAAYNSHGMSGNVSAAIAAFIARGQSVVESVDNAFAYIKSTDAASNALYGRGSELYKDFVNEIAAAYSCHNDVKYYADRLNVSSSYLAQVTKRIAGKAPKVIIDEYLLSEAESMLTSSGQTVQEIAYALGFSSQAHFSKFFKKLRMCTPSSYRRRQR